MVSILRLGVLDAEVIYHEGECDGVCFMFKQTRCVWCLVVSVLGEVSDESVLGQFAFYYDSVVVVCILTHVVFVDDVRREVVELYSHVLGLGQGGAKVKVLDVCRHESGQRITDDSIKKDFYEREGSGMCCRFAAVLYLVATNSSTYKVDGFSFFDFGANLGVIVRRLLVGWNVSTLD